MGRPKLRAVTEADKPVVPKTLKDAALLSERDLLVAMRAKILEEIDNGVPAAYLAPLTRQVRELDKELRALELRAKEEGADADALEGDEEFDPASL